MKKKMVVLGILLLVLSAGVLGGEVVGQAKKKAKENRETCLVGRMVACRETYKFDSIIKGIPDPYGRKWSLKKALEGEKVTWSSNSKKVVVNKKSFRVKKPGDYRLIAKTKKRQYVIKLNAVPKTKKIDTSQFTQVHHVEIISNDEGGKIATVTNKKDIDVLLEMLEKSTLVFDYKQNNHIPKKIGWSVSYRLYAADGTWINEPLIGGVSYENPAQSIIDVYMRALFYKYYEPSKSGVDEPDGNCV